MVHDVNALVVVDKRPYRKIAQDNWGLTNEQMKGMHVHHRVARCDGGTDDASNLYVCSPSMHRYGWHNGEEWIEWASAGGSMGGAVSGKTHAASGHLSKIAKESHNRHRGTKEYSERQLVKSLRAHVTKRREWTKELYDKVAEDYRVHGQSGYRTAKRLGVHPWKRVSHMIQCVESGFSYEELVDPDTYVKLYLQRVKPIVTWTDPNVTGLSSRG
jgi:hypothetical protein